MTGIDFLQDILTIDTASSANIGQMITFSKAEGFWLVLLLMFWMMLLFGGLMVGRPDSTRERRMPVWTRIGSSVVLVIAAGLFWLFLPDAPKANIVLLNGHQFTDYALFLFIGMTMGLIGDLFMANLMPMKRLRLGNTDPVLFGMLAFGIGHIAYIVGCLSLTTVDELFVTTGGEMTVAIVVWWIIAVIAWFLLIYMPSGDKTSLLHYAALPYALLLATTTGVAFGLWLQDSEFFFVALGALLFLVSDLILAMRLFNAFSFRLIDDVVWLTYGPGQMLIVVGIALLGLGIVPEFLGL